MCASTMVPAARPYRCDYEIAAWCHSCTHRLVLPPRTLCELYAWPSTLNMRLRRSDAFWVCSRVVVHLRLISYDPRVTKCSDNSGILINPYMAAYQLSMLCNTLFSDIYLCQTQWKCVTNSLHHLSSYTWRVMCFDVYISAPFRSKHRLEYNWTLKSMFETYLFHMFTY